MNTMHHTFSKVLLYGALLAFGIFGAWISADVAQFAFHPSTIEVQADGGSSPFQPWCNKPPSCSMWASPQTLSGTGNTTVYWNSTNTVGGEMDHGIGTLNYGTGSIPIYSLTQTTTFHARFWNSVGDYAFCDTTVTVTPPPPPAPTCTLDAAPTTIAQGGSSTLTWTTTNADTVSLSNLGSVSKNGSQGVSPSTTTTYDLSATGNGKTVHCTKTVTVTPPPQNGCIQIKKETYNTAGAALTPVAQFSFKLDGGVTVQNDANGDAIFTNVTPGTHTVTEVNAGSNWTQLSVTPTNGVVVVPSGSQCAAVVFKNKQVITPSCTLTSSKPGTNGDLALLSWTTTNASSISIDHSIGSVTPVASGSKSVNPSVATTYTATVIGPGGQATCSTTVTPPVNGCIQIKKETYDPSGAILTPVAAFSFKLDGGTVVQNDTNGDAIFTNVTPGTHTVTEVDPGAAWTQLSVTPANGIVVVPTGSQCAAVVFKNKQVTTLSPTCTFSASPSSLTAPGSVNLAWTTTNAASASIDNNVGAIQSNSLASGSVPVSVSSDTTFKLTVIGTNGQQVTCQAPVTITVPGLSCSLSLDQSTIRSGQSATLSWTAHNASSGSIDNSIGSVSPVAGGSVTVFPPSSTTYTGTFTDGTNTVTCSVPITVQTGGCSGYCGGGLNQPNVALFKKATSQPLAFVSLSQIPYTGFEAGPALTLIFWFAIAGLSAFVAYGIAGEGSMRHLLTFVIGGFMGVPLRRDEETHVHAHEPYPSFDSEDPFYGSAVHASVAAAPLPARPPVIPAASVSTPTTLPGIAEVIESRAHAAGVLMSPEAVALAAAASQDRAMALQLFGGVLDEAVRTIPREDGWIMLTTDRLQSIMDVKGVHTAAVEPVGTLDESAAAAFAAAVVSGDRENAFAIIRSLEHDHVSPMALMTSTATVLDKLYRARRDAKPLPDAVLADKALALPQEKLARLVEIFAHSLDHAYASPFTGVKLALAQAFEVVA